jgi:glycosyltransferase involved in cell wall biosynthesis
VVTHEVTTSADVAAILPGLTGGSVVLVDSLVASWAAEDLLAAAPRLRLVPLVHMAFETPGEAALLAAAPVVVATSGWSRRWLTDHYGLDPRRVHVAVPGVEVSDPVPGSAQGGELLCVGAVLPAKGQDVLVAALAALHDLAWRCRLVGPLTLDPDFVDSLHKAVADSGIGDRIQLAGTLAHDAMRAAYAAADLLVLPSRAESYGMVVTEALAHGVPVVASAVGGVPEAMGHGDDGSTPGVLVRPGDPDALAVALRGWLEDPRRRDRLRRAAARRRLTLPTWSHTTAEVATALEAAR